MGTDSVSWLVSLNSWICLDILTTCGILFLAYYYPLSWIYVSPSLPPVPLRHTMPSISVTTAQLDANILLTSIANLYSTRCDNVVSRTSVLLLCSFVSFRSYPP
jgi:hypothetical protein